MFRRNCRRMRARVVSLTRSGGIGSALPRLAGIRPILACIAYHVWVIIPNRRTPAAVCDEVLTLGEGGDGVWNGPPSRVRSGR